MSSLPWFRFYSEFVTDPEIEELSFEDQRHFVVLLCLKNNGLLDKKFVTDEKRHRAISRRVGLQGEAYTFMCERLLESGLVDENLQPRSWEKLQRKSDSSAERTARYRHRKRHGTSQERHSDAIDKIRGDKSREDKRGGVRPSKRCPKSFVVDDDLHAWAASKNFTADFVSAETEKFKNHEFKTARKDWPACWRNWLMRAKEYDDDRKSRTAGIQSDSQSRLDAINQRAGL